MSETLPPDLPRLRTLETWLVKLLAEVRAAIADGERREAERERGRRRRPPVPDWVLELGIGTRKTPVAVHRGDCHMPTFLRRRALSREDAVRALTAGIEACQLCRPDTELGVLD